MLVSELQSKLSSFLLLFYAESPIYFMLSEHFMDEDVGYYSFEIAFTGDNSRATSVRLMLDHVTENEAFLGRSVHDYDAYKL